MEWLNRKQWEIEEAFNNYKEAEIAKSATTAYLYKKYRDILEEIKESNHKK